MFEGPRGGQLQTALMVAAWILVAFLAVQVVSGVSGLRYIGAGVQATNTINVSGHGELFAAPDIATFTFSVVSDKSTVADAQADATAKINAVTAYLTGAGVDTKDIQTSGYSIYPQYDYLSAVCPQSAPVMYSAGSGASSVAYCPPGKQTLKGYEVRQTTTVKVRDISKAGDLLSGVGAKGATEVSSLSFTFDNPEAVQQQARDKAIADATAKAQTLAKELGVSLVRVVSFNETNGQVYYGKAMAYGMGGAADSAVAPSPVISTGQNQITDDVSITYEIR